MRYSAVRIFKELLKASAARERTCPQDRTPDAFGADADLRTKAEDCPWLILRHGGDAFVLLSASSPARSFAPKVEATLRGVG